MNVTDASDTSSDNNGRPSISVLTKRSISASDVEDSARQDPAAKRAKLQVNFSWDNPKDKKKLMRAIEVGNIDSVYAMLLRDKEATDKVLINGGDLHPVRNALGKMLTKAFDIMTDDCYDRTPIFFSHGYVTWKRFIATALIRGWLALIDEVSVSVALLPLFADLPEYKSWLMEEAASNKWLDKEVHIEVALEIGRRSIIEWAFRVNNTRVLEWCRQVRDIKNKPWFSSLYWDVNEMNRRDLARGNAETREWWLKNVGPLPADKKNDDDEEEEEEDDGDLYNFSDNDEDRPVPPMLHQAPLEDEPSSPSSEGESEKPAPTTTTIVDLTSSDETKGEEVADA